jgi:hypothetical protein
LAELEADLPPVGYFHVVFILTTETADVAFHNETVIYDLLFHASSEALLTIAANPRRVRGPRRTKRAPQIDAVLSARNVGHSQKARNPLAPSRQQIQVQ